MITDYLGIAKIATFSFRIYGFVEDFFSPFFWQMISPKFIEIGKIYTTDDFSKILVFLFLLLQLIKRKTKKWIPVTCPIIITRAAVVKESTAVVAVANTIVASTIVAAASTAVVATPSTAVIATARGNTTVAAVRSTTAAETRSTANLRQRRKADTENVFIIIANLLTICLLSLYMEGPFTLVARSHFDLRKLHAR